MPNTILNIERLSTTSCMLESGLYNIDRGMDSVEGVIYTPQR